MTFIFGGTTEGRMLAERAHNRGEHVVVCVASRYGARLLPDGVQVFDHPMDLPEMMEVVRDCAPNELLDATHPFATKVSENIRACANALGIGYVRIERAQSAGDWRDHVAWANDATEAAALIVRESGNIFLSTGMNTLSTYAQAIDPKRLFVRVLPTVQAISMCDVCGLLPSHIVAMQGPFAAPLNAQMYRHFAIRHLVTKDSGDMGGVAGKVLPALEMGLNVVAIRRPKEG